MDRAEATGFGIAAAGHLALLAALSLGFASTVTPPAFNPPMEISFVEDVALDSAGPTSAPAAATIAPELGAPEEAAPATEPEPASPAPAPEPEPAPPAPAPPRPQPKQVAKAPPPKAAPPKAAPKAPPAKNPPAKQATPKAAAKAPAAKQAAPKAAPKQQQAKNAGKGQATKTGGSRLGKDFLKGIGSDPAAKNTRPSGAVMNTQAAANIDSAIRRQIQPCADRQVNPGPGASRITVRLNLKLNRNGTLNGRPTVAGTLGVDDENRRYEQRVKDLAINAFTSCSPLKGLPAELYDVPRGWSNIIFRYKLPD